jgi:hypothetical protein
MGEGLNAKDRAQRGIEAEEPKTETEKYGLPNEGEKDKNSSSRTVSKNSMIDLGSF